MISDTFRLRWIAALASLAVTPSLGLAQDARDDELRLLREQIRHLDQKLRVLERKQELKDWSIRRGDPRRRKRDPHSSPASLLASRYDPPVYTRKHSI
jgi:hypothetical protein